ncbi:MAG TPA: hypothetical protein VL283_01825 [Candidatus Baltobacteraceae bacterium]|nr:hypothetical protein [Candidatus Baltobacteraceae bacterium]
MAKKKPVCKPSGYDVVISASLAIKALNKRITMAWPKARGPLIDEKDKLMHAMWEACPHDSVADGELQTRPGPGAEPIARSLRFCTSCGFDETPPFKILVRRKGRTIARFVGPAFRAKLDATLLFTGINIKGS